MVNPDVMWMSILAENPKTLRKTQKVQPTENEKNNKYQNVTCGCPFFTFTLPGERFAPCQLRHCTWSTVDLHAPASSIQSGELMMGATRVKARLLRALKEMH